MCITAAEVSVGDKVSLVKPTGLPYSGVVERIVTDNAGRYAFLVSSIWSAWYGQAGTLWCVERTTEQ